MALTDIKYESNNKNANENKNEIKNNNDDKNDNDNDNENVNDPTLMDITALKSSSNQVNIL